MQDLVAAPELLALPFFAGLVEADLEPLLDRHRLVSIPAGQTLVMEADWGESLMVLMRGLAKVRSFSADGEEIVLSLIGRGDVLGEMALLDGQPRSADVVTLSEVRLLKLNGQVFMRQVQQSNHLALQMARLQAKRLRELNRRFSLQRSDATTRLLDALAYLACKSSGSDDPLATSLPLPQGEIAILAGLARETSSRAMSKLRQRGLVAQGDDGALQLTTLDPLRKRGLVQA